MRDFTNRRQRPRLPPPIFGIRPRRAVRRPRIPEIQAGKPLVNLGFLKSDPDKPVGHLRFLKSESACRSATFHRTETNKTTKLRHPHTGQEFPSTSSVAKLIRHERLIEGVYSLLKEQRRFVGGADIQQQLNYECQATSGNSFQTFHIFFVK